MSRPCEIFLTGATGFVGRALVQQLVGKGYEVVAWVRDPERARQRLGSVATLCATGVSDAELCAQLSRADAIVNLAGESVLSRRWTEARRRALVASRVATTRRVVSALERASSRPRVLISASAVGYYGEQGSRPLAEHEPAGSGFLAQLCAQWEAAAFAARSHGLRVAVLRIGIVLGSDGGALAAMVPAFRLGLGGPLGSGEQYVPFILLDDLVRVIVRGLEDSRFTGAINCAAPEAVTSRELARTLGSLLRRPAWLRAPAWALHLVLGARAEVALQSQRALPAALHELGFEFAAKTLREAITAVLASGATVDIRRAQPGDAEGAPREPRYVLEQRTRLQVDQARAFEFFCRAENLGLITPGFMRFQMTREPESLGEGSVIEYNIGLGPLPMHWRTIIRRWQPPRGFIDEQAAGPYALWWHEHRLVADVDGLETLMLDRVSYSLPLGPLGALAHRLAVAPMLRAIFGYRAEAIARLFGTRAQVMRETAARATS